MKSPKSKSQSNLPEAIFSLGTLLAILGGINFATAHFNSTEAEVLLPVSSNTRRNIAIQEALNNGQKTYQYETNFIPGIGNITDPEAYKKQFEDNALE